MIADQKIVKYWFIGTKHLLAGRFNIFSLRISVDFSFFVLNKSCDLFLGSLRLYKTFM